MEDVDDDEFEDIEEEEVGALHPSYRELHLGFSLTVITDYPFPSYNFTRTLNIT